MQWVKVTDRLSSVLVTLGGLNMGLIGFFKYDLLASLFGDGTGLHRVVLAIIGLAAVYMVPLVFRAAESIRHYAHA